MRIVFNQGEIDKIHKQSILKTKLLAHQVKDAAKSNAPVKTGALRDSIDVTEIGAGSFTIGSPLVYAMFVEAKKPFLIPALMSVVLGANK